jgi:hypothetical protein
MWAWTSMPEVTDLEAVHCERSLEYDIEVGVKLPFWIELKLAVVCGSTLNLAEVWIDLAGKRKWVGTVKGSNGRYSRWRRGFWRERRPQSFMFHLII